MDAVIASHAGADETGVTMGPLPQLHKLVFVGMLLIGSIGAGLWLAQYFMLPVGGIGVGLGAGCLLAYLLTHDFHDRSPRSVRIRRR